MSVVGKCMNWCKYCLICWVEMERMFYVFEILF